MMRTFVVVAVAVLLAQVFAARMLTIDFVAIDCNGCFVQDLKPFEVEVWVGQFWVLVQWMIVVTSEADERGGRIIVLLLDDMMLRFDSMECAREAARTFVNRMGDRDRVAVLTMSGIRMDAISERVCLLQAIDQYLVRATLVMRSDMLGRHVLDTFAGIVSQMVEAVGRRKTIVGIGLGWLFDRLLSFVVVGQDLLFEWVCAMRAMALLYVNLYVIDLLGVGTSWVDGGQEGLAREIGGHAFFNTNDLKGAVDRILAELANFYMVDILDLSVGAKVDLRLLELKSLCKGVMLRARYAIFGSF